MSQTNPLYETIRQIVENIAIELPDQVLPDPSIINYYKFEQDRKLFLDQDVGYPIMEMIKLIMRWNMEDKEKPVEERNPITIYIMSDGGSMAYMWSMLDVMLASKTPIITVNLGIAASSAALIFMAGSKRFMLSKAITVIHQGSAEVAGDANKIMDAVDNYKLEIDKMKSFILSRTQINPKLFSKRNKDDWYIDANTCLSYGICDKIVESIDEII